MSSVSDKFSVPSTVEDHHGVTYRKGHLLGKGGFARCYQFHNTDTKHIYAAKILSKKSFTKKAHHEKVAVEIRLHRKLKHPNIVNLFYSFEDDYNVYIMLELCSRQTLMELHKRRGAISSPEARYFMKQIVAGVSFIHKCNIIHRDLKIGNIFLNESLNVKIGDFGLAVSAKPEGTCSFSICGTPNYIAPEILRKQVPGFEVDIWALGCILYTLLVGRPPFESTTLEETYLRISKNDYEIPCYMHNAAAHLITKLLSAEPTSRPQITNILKFTFFHGFTPKSLPMSCLTMAPQFDTVRGNNYSSTALQSNSFEDSSDKTVTPGESSTEKRKNSLRNAISIITEMIRLLLSSNAPERKFEAEDDAEAPECMPVIWISSWIDYTKKYGVAYTFCDNSAGFIFNDQTRLLLDECSVNMHYVEKGTEMNIVVGSQDLSENLYKKLRLLRVFRDYMTRKLVKTGASIARTDGNEIARLPSVCCCIRTNTAMLFQLTNGVVQINFLNHAKIIFCPHLRTITLIEILGEMHTYNIDDLARLGYPKALRHHLEFCCEILSVLQNRRTKDQKTMILLSD